MDPYRPGPALLAPAAGGGDALRFPPANAPLPAVDQHIVKPETRAEIINGALHFAPPADEPHATMHLDLAYVLCAHVAPGYRAAVDMLTRTGHTSDFAPDASVYPAERDPATGGRKLEDLAIEIVSEQPLGVATEKAQELARRGVRRIFCVAVRKRKMLEWSRETSAFSPLPDTAEIRDPAFIRPLPVRAVLDATEADGAVIKALLAKGSPALRALRDEGRLEGQRAALLTLLGARGLSPDAALRERIASCTDPAALERWTARAAVASMLEAIFRP
jgi:Uma2 family endonuclease